jgi:hypothetical protein
MDKFLDAHNIPKLNKEVINHLNRPIASNEVEAVIKNLPTRKIPGSDGLMAKFFQT